MINELIKLANHFDEMGETKLANYTDALVKKASIIARINTILGLEGSEWTRETDRRYREATNNYTATTQEDALEKLEAAVLQGDGTVADDNMQIEFNDQGVASLEGGDLGGAMGGNLSDPNRGRDPYAFLRDVDALPVRARRLVQMYNDLMQGARDTAQMITSAANERGREGVDGNYFVTEAMASSGESGAQEAALALHSLLYGAAQRSS
tara:strand:+ start:657 stop:1286 length:630 start_codon:yes stop_codon:yes gene_type:complete